MLRNHYSVDVIFGIILSELIWRLNNLKNNKHNNTDIIISKDEVKELV